VSEVWWFVKMLFVGAIGASVLIVFVIAWIMGLAWLATELLVR
jgi:hypothetical protein